MRGHEALLQMRRSGVLPSSMVSIDLVSSYTSSSSSWPRWTPCAPQVEIEDRESLARLDLRFAFGMNTLVSGPDVERLERVASLVAELSNHTYACLTSEDPYVVWRVFKGAK